MNIRKVISIVLIVASIALAVVSFLLLPEVVVTQVSLGGSGASTMPKIVAVALPALLGIGGGIASLTMKGDDKGSIKTMIVSAAGVLVFILMLVVNL